MIPYWRNLSAVSLEDDLQLDKSNKCSYNKIIATLGYISQSNNLNEKLNSGFGPNARVNSI